MKIVTTTVHAQYSSDEYLIEIHASRSYKEHNFELIVVRIFRIESKSKSKKTLFNVGQCKQYNISSHLKWVLVADKRDI